MISSATENGQFAGAAMISSIPLPPRLATLIGIHVIS
jgi:hypothetical protein